MRQIAVFLVTAAVMAAGAGPAVASDAQRIAAADNYERAGDLDAAYVQLSALDAPTKAQRAHRAHVRTAAGAVAAAAALTKLGAHAEAKRTLDAALATLSPGDDAVVRARLAEASAAAAQQVAKAAAAARATANEQASATLLEGDALRRRGHYGDAAKMYKTVATAPASEVDAAIRQQATAKQMEAEEEAVAAQPGALRRFWDAVWDGIRSVLQWVLVPALLLAVLWIPAAAYRRRLRKHPKDGVRLVLQDAGEAMKDRSDRDAVLAAELSDALDEVRYGGYAAGGSEIDERRDLDGMAPPATFAAAGPGALADLADQLEISVGPVKLTPLGLIAPLRAWLARPCAYELRGMLRTADTTTELCVALHDTRRPEVVKGPWTASASTRADAVRVVAEKYMVGMHHSYVSSSWRSYAAYREGLLALAEVDDERPAKERVAQLDAARAAFQRAVNSDQGNLLARMRLAGVLRALGHNPDAAAEFRQLVDDVRKPASLPKHARTLVDNHPELLYLAAINRAVSLDKWSDRDRFEVSDDLAFVVGRLAKATDGVPDIGPTTVPPEFARAGWPVKTLREPERMRLLVTALAAWAASLLRTVGCDHDRCQDLAVVRGRLDQVCRWIEQLDGRDTSVAAAQRQAEGTLRNAIARVAYDQGRQDEARHEAETALVLVPQLGDAHVTLAQIGIVGSHEDANWSREAERHLRRALDISPRDDRARFLLGELHQEVGEDEEAIAQFAELKDDPRAAHRIGVIHVENDDYPKAVPWLVRSQRRGPSHGRRAKDLVEAVIALRGVPSAWMLRHDGAVAVKAGERIVAAAETQAKRDAASEQLGVLKDAVAELTERPHEAVPDVLAMPEAV